MTQGGYKMRMLSPIWNSRSLASDLFNEWDQIFKATPGITAYDEREFAPATDVAETDDCYMISIDLPGLKIEDIKIEVTDNVLNVSGERKTESKFDDGQTHRVERSYGSFKRSFTLPKAVGADDIEAHYENGVLDVRLPKTKLSQSKKIEIQSGKATEKAKEIVEP